MLRYAGIGSRETPDSVLMDMRIMARVLGQRGWQLRTGGARGADQAFELGALTDAKVQSEIHVPWNGYNNRSLKEPGVICPLDGSEIDAEIRVVTRSFHPAWEKCSEAARRLHMRNTTILLGANLRSYVHMVICWTSNGHNKGGTGQGMRIAQGAKIPIFNLYYADAQQKCSEFVEMMEKKNVKQCGTLS